MKVTEKSLRNYLIYLQKKHLNSFPTISLSILSRGDVGYSIIKGGYALVDKKRIEVQKWMLVDKRQAYMVVRHEIAHFLHAWTGQEVTKSHGKEFKKALKIISPKRWKTDLHWKETPEIFAAMTKLPERVKYIAKCKSCDFERLYKRVPAFVRNKKATCPMCKGHDFTIQKVTV